MSPKREKPVTTPVPRIALRMDEAAAALGVSRNSFDRYVAPDLRMYRQGKIRLVAVTELQRWIDDHSERVLGY